ncbi:transmembrane protein 179 [Achroia grisella]|uniref:transmembrane protein 179 n=1 Tax=Achroia grisella TaxID=688607 RepID=UPI0027D2713D|nr:transmembrane protein 179 [Achroia grisella]
MALTNVLLLSQIAAYVIGFILSLCIIVPLSMHQDEFSGHCLLFCDMSCGWNISLSLYVCLVQMYRLSRFMYKGLDSSFLSAFIEAVGCVMLCGLTVSAAVMVTLGFMTWCQNIVERFPSCEDAAGQNIDSKDNISTNGFYVEIGTAQFGVWGAFATWVGLAVFSTLKVCRYHQLENIQVSMYRERQRLVNENEAPPAAAHGDLEPEGRSTPPLRAS